MNTKNPQRLQRKIEELHKNWELLGDVLAKLNRERILETRADEKMRLEQKIADIEAERQQVEQQLDALEAQVGTDDTHEDVAGRKPEPHSEPPQSPETPSGQPTITTGKDYFERVAGNVYTGPVTIHQHGGQQEAEKQATRDPQRISLRSKPLTVSGEEFREVFRLDKSNRPLRHIRNQFEDQGEVVIDHATDLMWQKAGSETHMSYENAQRYVEELNHRKFASYNDWRLPTIPELMSLLEPEKQSNDLYINPIFDSKQFWCWSADKRPIGESPPGLGLLLGKPIVDNTQSRLWSADMRTIDEKQWRLVWCVKFLDGCVLFYDLNDDRCHVRCVRSIK